MSPENEDPSPAAVGVISSKFVCFASILPSHSSVAERLFEPMKAVETLTFGKQLAHFVEN